MYTRPTFEQQLIEADVSSFNVEFAKTSVGFTRLEVRTRQIQQHTTSRTRACTASTPQEKSQFFHVPFERITDMNE